MEQKRRLSIIRHVNRNEQEEAYKLMYNYSPGQRPNGVSELATRFFYHRFIDFFDNWPPAWDPGSAESAESVRRCGPGDPGVASRTDFYRSFDDPKRHRKISDFLEASKINRNGTPNRPWCAQGSLLDEKT